MDDTPFVTEPSGRAPARVDVSNAKCDGRSRPYPSQGTPRSDYQANTEELCQGRYSGRRAQPPVSGHRHTHSPLRGSPDADFDQRDCCSLRLGDRMVADDRGRSSSPPRAARRLPRRPFQITRLLPSTAPAMWANRIPSIIYLTHQPGRDVGHYLSVPTESQPGARGLNSIHLGPTFNP
jgi:hypothetical protein